MLRQTLSKILDALLPPAPIVQKAKKIHTQDIESLALLQRYSEKPWLYFFLPYADERIRTLIRAAKYHSCKHSVQTLSTICADPLLEVLHEASVLGSWSTPVIMPVPSSRERMRERGYNQAERFARSLAAHIELPLETRALSRMHRQSQVHVKRSERTRNVKNAFSANESVRGAYIILVDDVVESGATLAEARAALIKAGAADVVAVAIAH